MSLPQSKTAFRKEGRFLMASASLKEKITMPEELCIPNYFFMSSIFENVPKKAFY